MLHATSPLNRPQHTATELREQAGRAGSEPRHGRSIRLKLNARFPQREAGERTYDRQDQRLCQRACPCFGSFERHFQLPDDIEPDKIEATFKNGVLSVTLPKSAEAQQQAKKIEVKAG